MTAPERSAAARQVRNLSAAGRFAEAQLAFEDYCRALAAAVAGLPPEDPRIKLLEKEWQALLGETRRSVLAGRAHAAVRLGRLSQQPAQRFGERPQARHTWEMLA